MKFIVLCIVLLLLPPLQILWNWATPHADLPAGRPRPQTADPALWFHTVSQPGFTIGYGEWLRNPLWVAWQVHDEALLPLGRRPRNFRCATGTLARICPEDFSHSGYDRGHLAPNYAMSRLFGRAAQQASFSMSNISPQRGDMNRRAWQRLEEIEMDVLRAEPGPLWVIAGPIFDSQPPRLASGVAVPRAFYRIWAQQQGGALRMLAFVVPQQAGGRENLREFMRSVDQVEQLTRLDFFPLLPALQAEAAEASLDPEAWGDDALWRRPPRY